MKSAKMLTILVMALALMVCLPEVSMAVPMGTAWTYQGRLMDANGPADGVFEFEFKLYDSPSGGNQLESTFSLRGIDVIDGYFTVEPDFGSDVFDSNECWLEIGVRPGDTVEPFTTLSPRQRMAPTPYALQTRGIFVDDIPYIISYPGTWTAKESDRMWRSVAMSAEGTKQTAAAAFGQIYISTDSGNTWTAKESNKFWTSVAMSADGTKQTAVVHNGQIYVSTDSGNTWTAKESNRYWNSVAMSADGTIQTAAGQNTQIYVSTDSGDTWTGKDFFRNWQSVAMSADGTIQTAVVYGGQIYVSTYSGEIWAAKESNRNWVSVAMSADGTKQTAVVYNGQIYVSTDSGNTWTAKEANRGWQSVAMSADGTKQTAVVNNGQVYFSTDSGNTWTATESNRAWMSVAMSADGTKHTAVVDQGQIYVCSADVSYSYSVGIGTTSPSGSLYPESTTLEIAGNAPSIVLDDQWGIAQDDFEISNGGDKVLFRNATDGLDILTMGIAGGVEGCVGIGTMSPASKLDVQGGGGSNAISATSTAGGGFAAISATTSSANTYGVWGSSSDYVGGHFESTTGTALEASTSSGYAATFMGGNVGIGTANPNYKLDVFSIDEHGFRVGNTNSWFTFFTGGNSRLGLGDGNGNEAGFIAGGENLSGENTLTIAAGDDAGNKPIYLTLHESGNVGIGRKIIPAEMLHINKPSGSLGLRVSSDATSYQYMNFGATNGYSIGRAYDDKFFINRDEPLGSGVLRALTIQPDGKVGIGTSSPGDKLDVNGDININSVYKIAGETVLSNSGSQNIFVGVEAGASNTYGRENTFLGFFAGHYNTGDPNTLHLGSFNTFVGNSAGANNETGSDNTFVGCSAGRYNTEGYVNTFLGYKAGRYNTEGYYNTFLGAEAGRDNTEGYYNTFVGTGAGLFNTTGDENTFLGVEAGRDNMTGSGNVFIGNKAGYNETGSNKLYIANNKTTPLVYGNFSTGRVGINTTSPQGQLDVNGSIYQRGGVLHSDYVFETGYDLESIEEHSEFMWKHKHLKAIQKRQVDENGIEIIEVGAHRRGIVEELEKAHIYIEQLNNRIKTLEEKLTKLETGLNNVQ